MMESFLNGGEGAMVSSGKQIGDARGGLAGRGVLPLALLAVVAGGPARAPANVWGADAPDVLPEVSASSCAAW